MSELNEQTNQENSDLKLEQNLSSNGNEPMNTANHQDTDQVNNQVNSVQQVNNHQIINHQATKIDTELPNYQVENSIKYQVNNATNENVVKSEAKLEQFKTEQLDRSAKITKQEESTGDLVKNNSTPSINVHTYYSTDHRIPSYIVPTTDGHSIYQPKNHHQTNQLNGHLHHSGHHHKIATGHHSNERAFGQSTTHHKANHLNGHPANHTINYPHNQVDHHHHSSHHQSTKNHSQKLHPNHLTNQTNEELINQHRLVLSNQQEDDDNNSVFLSPTETRQLFNQQNEYLNQQNLIQRKLKKKSPKKKQIIQTYNPNVHHLTQANCVNLNNLSPNQLNDHLNRLNSGQFILTEHSTITVQDVMEESSDEEKPNEQDALYNDLNRITINSHDRYQYLHQQNTTFQHFHHHPGDEKRINGELITPTYVQSNPAALLTLQQRRQLQQQQIQQRKEQTVKYMKNRSSIDGLNGLIFVLSAIYAKLIVILGLCFPIAEVISHRIPIGWYEGFYLYLYLGSIFFLATIYMFKESSKHKKNTISKLKQLLFWSSVQEPEKNKLSNTLVHENSFTDNSLLASGNISIHSSCSENDSVDQNKKAHYGSFYLRLGAVAFGIGSMIYSGLEFGQFFELENKEQCYSFLLMVLPTSHMIFTFAQLYFIFLNTKSLIVKHRYLTRFGLMHMIATNLCVWLHVLIQETKHQIMILLYPNKGHNSFKFDNLTTTTSAIHPLPTFASFLPQPVSNFQNLSFSLLTSNLSVPVNRPQNQSVVHQLMKRSIEDHEIFTTHGICRRSNVIGELVMDASQFLFPCTIEYSLICAAILYIMWKSTDFSSGHGQIGSTNDTGRVRHRSATSSSTVNYQDQKHYYQVDCAKAHKGLFCGIFLLVVCIISLILFFVLIKKPNYKSLGILQAHVVEIILYVINAFASIIAIVQFKELPYNRERNVELDNILLIVAQFGLYLFNGFSLIGAHFYHDITRNPSTSTSTQLVKLGAIVCLVQATLQTVFILDATKRMAYNSDQVRRKPGREMVTFLLVCNFSMWAINTLETRRSESTPIQLKFFGSLAWSIFSNITTPLTIFFRFHSTVCLCDIWKRTYKLKNEF